MLGSVEPMTFLAKKEIGAPALGGRLARLQGIIFVDRGRRRCIPAVNAEMARAMVEGEPVVLFAEATTGDGNRILPFRSSHFEAVREAAAAGAAAIQPVFLDYSRVVGLPVGRRDRPLFAWYGDTTFMPHFRRFVAVGTDPLRRPLRPADPGFGRNGAQDPRPPDRSRGSRPRRRGPGRQLPYSRRRRFVVERTCFGRRPSLPSTTATDAQQRDDATDVLPARRAFIKSFGCQMNVYDSQRMADVAGQEGYEETANVEDADLVILNTCHIRERASEKIFSELGKLRVLKAERERQGRSTTLVVAGCVAQAEGEEIRRRQPAVDFVVGPQNYHRLPQLLRDRPRGAGAIDTEFAVEDKFDHLPPSRPQAIRARGADRLRHRPGGLRQVLLVLRRPLHPRRRGFAAGEVGLDEIARLTAAGVGEITLIGQNVNAYRGRDANGEASDLAALLAAAAEIPGVLRLRYATSHPNDMSDSLIAAHRDNPALAPYLHLPIQAGADRILAAMNRKHRVRDYLDIVARVRRARPDVALSSDFIVGFPGETDAEFRADPGGRARGRLRLRPTRSSIRRGPARRPPTSPTRSTTRSRRSGSPSFTP